MIAARFIDRGYYDVRVIKTSSEVCNTAMLYHGAIYYFNTNDSPQASYYQ